MLRDWESEWWEFPNVKSNHPEKTNHPCQYPIELVERCILALTNKNDWVLDPFGGVGSTVIAALKNGRNALGIDKEREYCDIAESRIKKFRDGELKFRPMTKEIHKPSKNDKVAQIPLEWKQNGI